MESISTNGSLSTADKAPKLSSSKKAANKADLKSKIADSKKRCQDVIEKFKNMNLKIWSFLLFITSYALPLSSIN